MPARLRLWIAASLLLVLLLVPGAAWAMPAHGGNAAPVAGGALCVLAFDDANSNGVQDSGESLVAGVVFTVRDETHVMIAYTTDGQNEPHCFDLLPGKYRVAEIDAPGRGATGEQSWFVTVQADVQSTVAYASHAGGGRAPTTDLGSALYGLSGIAFFVAAAAVGGFVIIRNRAK